MKQRFSEGLKIKLLYPDGESKAAAFIEFVPGEHAWRSVSAAGYIFIHCIWVSPDKNKNQGYASALLDDCVAYAHVNGFNGVAAVTSSDSFMADKQLFIRNGFKITESGKNYDLVVKTLKAGKLPSMNNWEEKLSNYQGLHIVYSAQCPWVARFVDEVRKSNVYQHLNIQYTELRTPAEAQQAPSFYSVFSLINNGKLLSAHYISTTRFNNILKKEKLMS